MSAAPPMPEQGESTPTSARLGADGGESQELGRSARFWRNRVFPRTRHNMAWMRRSSAMMTRFHARLIRLSGGRIRRSFIFTGGMPILVLTTTGRKSGQSRSTPVGFVPFGDFRS